MAAEARALVVRRIQRYALGAICTLQMPKDAELLSVHVSDGAIYLSALIDQSAETVVRTFAIFGAGEYVRPEMRHVASVDMRAAGMFFHVFEKEDD